MIITLAAKNSRPNVRILASTDQAITFEAHDETLHDVAEIINRVLPWAGSVPQAFAWYRAQPIPSFGDRTPEDLVKEGKAEAVKAYLSRIAIGGYA